MKDMVSRQLTEFIQTYKEMDGLCHAYAKEHGLSDTAFYVLYALVTCGNAYPQRELCEDWSYPPQTVNSALKALENQGIVGLTFSSGNRKNKEISLTEKGKTLAKEIITPFMKAERKAFSSLNADERDMLLSVIHKYISRLNAVIKTIPEGAS